MEKITYDGIAMDMRNVMFDRDVSTIAARMTYVAFSAPWIFIFALASLKFVSIALALFSVYHIVRMFIQLFCNARVKKVINRGLERGDVSVSVERFSHVSREWVFERRFSLDLFPDYKRIWFWYFSSGANWRVPEWKMHYRWSELAMYTRGLKDLAVQGDEFYMIKLNADPTVKYIYNKKLFVFEEK